MTSQTKTEIVCIKRQGFSILHTEGADFAAKVTMLRYEPGKTYDPRIGVVQEMLIPLIGNYW
jgi:hypothetical protein